MKAGVIACVALLAVAVPVAGAQTTWGQVRDRGVLRVGVPGDYAPYALWRDDGNAIEGVDIALSREIAAGLGLGVEFVPTSWRMLMEDARAGRFDVAVGGIGITPERRREVRFTRPWIRDHKVPLVRCGTEARYDTRAEINQPGVRVVANPGGTNERFAREAFPAAQLSVHADNIGVFDEVAAARADVFVTDGVEARLQARLHPQLCAVERAPDWHPVGKGMLVAADTDTRRAMDAGLSAALRRQGYAARLDEWLDEDWLPGVFPDITRELAQLVDDRLAVVTEVARWKWNRNAPIEDPAREASLMAAQRSAAAELGVPEARVEAFFGAQILAARQLQHDLFARWRQAGAGKFEGVADLDGQLRPRIDAINARMLVALSHWDGTPSPAVRGRALRLGQSSPLAEELALGPLVTAPGTPAASQGR